MDKPNATLITTRGVIAGLPDDDQVKIKALAERLRSVIAQEGAHGLMALALIAAEHSDD